MDWDKLRVFHAVAEAGSLTHAGESLHLSQSAVSRQIRGLEDDIGAPLFHRHARGLLLTREGEHLFDATRAISGAVVAAGARIRDCREKIDGELRVTTTVGFGTLWLAPRLNKFLDIAPELNVDLMLTEAVLDLPMREADVAIRMREPAQSDVVRRPLMNVAIRLYACPRYVEQRGAPQSASELSDHRLVCYSPDAPQPVTDMNWLFDHLPAQKRLITVNNYYGVLQGARSGWGVAAIPDYMAREHGGLVQVAPEVTSPRYTVYLVYPEEMRGSRRIILFRDFLIEEINQFSHSEGHQAA